MGKRVADMTPEEREANRARCAAWRCANREKARAYRIGRYAGDPEKERAAAVRRYADDPEKGRAKSAAWRAANPEKATAVYLRYNIKHCDAKVKAHLRLDHGITDPPPELVELIVTLRKLKRVLRAKANG